jgi:hypothetical protein
MFARGGGKLGLHASSQPGAQTRKPLVNGALGVRS